MRLCKGVMPGVWDAVAREQLASSLAGLGIALHNDEANMVAMEQLASSLLGPLLLASCDWIKSSQFRIAEIRETWLTNKVLRG